MFILLSLIVAIAAFNIISSLSMMVKDKQKDIAVLRTFGLSPAGVMLIFVIQGTVIGAVGILAGTLVGLALAHNITEVVAFFEGLFGGKIVNIAPEFEDCRRLARAKKVSLKKVQQAAIVSYETKGRTKGRTKGTP